MFNVQCSTFTPPSPSSIVELTGTIHFNPRPRRRRSQISNRESPRLGVRLYRTGFEEHAGPRYCVHRRVYEELGQGRNRFQGLHEQELSPTWLRRELDEGCMQVVSLFVLF